MKVQDEIFLCEKLFKYKNYACSDKFLIYFIKCKTCRHICRDLKENESALTRGNRL